jgi:hypothetical protein
MNENIMENYSELIKINEDLKAEIARPKEARNPKL